MKSKGLWQGGGSREGSRNTADIKREMGKMGKGAVTGEGRENGGEYRRKEVGQITPRLFDKALRNYIILYLPKHIYIYI